MISIVSEDNQPLHASIPQPTSIAQQTNPQMTGEKDPLPAVPLYFPTDSLYRSLLDATWKKSYTA